MRYWCHRCLLVVVYFIRIWVWRGNKKIDFGYSWCMCGARWNCLCGCWGGKKSLPSGIYTAYHIVDFVVVSAALLSFKRTGLVIVHISPQQAIFIAGCGGSGWKRGREKRTDKKSYPLNRKWRRWKSVNINKCVEWILAPPKKSTSVCVCVFVGEWKRLVYAYTFLLLLSVAYTVESFLLNFLWCTPYKSHNSGWWTVCMAYNHHGSHHRQIQFTSSNGG